ncbi:C39 family peptidase [Pseudoflavonifractor phocaeensis]|uniref:C39 family peptidase n=1 Tax=Pseudoflavonifractor phocaeensis TaxID=1870988 RepID=UPI001957C4C5|nr:C39 family peptidase [Pseudoflavonifractor phocaeensis]MBM6724550.1 C39 family peptidase [Pseudoflavonifractor phocaeensis]
MKKKLLSLLLTFALIFTLSSTAFAIDTIPNSSQNLLTAASEEFDVPEENCTTEMLSSYIYENTDTLATIYETAFPESEKTFSATSVEFQIPVYVVTLDKEGVYLDFNGDNGYMILVDGNDVIAWETTGDLGYLKGLNSTYYSIFDGFGYYAGTQFLPYCREYLTEEELQSINFSSNEPYEGQNSAGDGDIVTPSTYVSDRYGPGYKVENGDSKSLPKSFSYFRQWDLSIYYEIKNGSKYSEGNCSLSSIFALMNYLKTSGKYTSLPSASSKTSYDATKDSFYTKYKNKSNYSIETPKQLPNLYLAIRQYAIDNYGYEVSNTNPFNITTIIKDIGSKYGETISANHVLVWSYESQVVNQIDAGYPVIINVANSSTYGSHSMVVTGYSLYTKTNTVAGLNIKDYVKLIKVNDNWSAGARYFDFTNYVALGSFVTVK